MTNECNGVPQLLYATKNIKDKIWQAVSFSVFMWRKKVILAQLVVAKKIIKAESIYCDGGIKSGKQWFKKGTRTQIELSV